MGYYQGSGLPCYTLNLYQQLRLHRFQLEAQLDGLFGYQIIKQTLQYLDEPSGYENNSARTSITGLPATRTRPCPDPAAIHYLTSATWP